MPSSNEDLVVKEDHLIVENEGHDMNQVLFVEEHEVLSLIEVISLEIQDELHLSSQKRNSLSDVAASLHRLRVIFDKYLECPTLLDPSLESLIVSLTAPILESFHSWEGQVSVHERNIDNQKKNGSEDDIYTFIESIRYHLSVVYYLCKVRGRKYIQRFLPHHVSDVIPVWMALQSILKFQLHLSSSMATTASTTTCISTTTEDESNTSVGKPPPEEIAPLWETIYVLWIWMSTLSLVPFDSHKFASSHSNFITVDEAEIELPFAFQLMNTCQRHLNDTGPIRTVVSVCLSSWLSRPDKILTNQEHPPLNLFISHTRNVIESYLIGHGSNSSDLFRVLGVVQTVTTVLKTSTMAREDLLKQMIPLWEPLLQLSQQSTNDILLQKLMVKWWTRISCTLLPPRLASWRYQRGQRFLFQLQPDKTQSIAVNNTDTKVGNEYMDELEMVPAEVEYAMGRIIDALSNASTIVRWSAAKGVGRITERLPSLCADDILDAILLLLQDTDNDRCWHGACLALAELARRGLLLPRRLHEVIPLLLKAVHFDRRRGSINVGANVRDAACYTYWAFARAYDPKILQPFITDMTRAVILASLFDREVNCRRSASSAFQEAVGRQGATNFPHGIEILTAADYFTLGNRTNAYLSLAIQIANYDELREPIIQHLYTSKLYHWDINIRTLSSKALHKLTILDPKYMCDLVIPKLLEKSLDEKDLFTRHGAVLGLAEIVLSLSENGILSFLPSNIEELLTELVPTIERKRLYRGRGGEIMRSAVCRLMECISLSRIPMSVKGQVRLLDSIESNIPHPTEVIQEDACRALEALMSSYFPVGATGPSPRLQQRVVNKFVDTIRTTENPAIARGYALALGHLPLKIICPSAGVFTSILDSLIKTAHHNASIGGESDAETRRNSLRSLVRISRLVLDVAHDKHNTDDTSQYPTVGMDKRTFDCLCEAFLAAMDDYRTDRRGDVGSWCRLVAMDGITELLLTVASDERTKSVWIVDDVLVTTTLGVIFRQLADKLDYVRHRAGACIQQLVSSRYLVDAIQSHSELVMLLNQSQSIENRWVDPSLTFLFVMNVLSTTNITIYFECIVTGIVSSIGGLTENVYKHASTSLLQFMKKSCLDRKEQLLMYLLHMLHQRNNRLVQPLLKTLDLLLTHDYCCDIIRHQEKMQPRCFIEQSIQCLQREATLSTNVSRLFLLVDVSVSLLTTLLSCNQCGTFEIERKRLLAFLCSMLTHPFPRVRSYVAEQMYTYLLENDNIENHSSNDNMNGNNIKSATIQELLLTTLWSNDNVDEVMVHLQQVTKQMVDEFGIDFEFQKIVTITNTNTRHF